LIFNLTSDFSLIFIRINLNACQSVIAKIDLETRGLRKRFSATRVRKFNSRIFAAAAAISDHAAAIVALFPSIKAR
jgi:hypothetical protein